jgi:hypothetical protein
MRNQMFTMPGHDASGRQALGLMSANKEVGGHPVLSVTLKTTLVLGTLAYGVASWLSGGGLERAGLERIAANDSRLDEPLTTGSLGTVRHSPRLDPCVLLRP